METLNTNHLESEVAETLPMYSDMTEYNDLQAQSQQTQKMEALGHMASGVIHDFNNLLTVIAGNTEMMMISVDTTNPIRQHIEEIRNASNRATRLIDQLQSFSRRQPIELSIINVNTIVQEMNRMLRRIIGEKINLKTPDNQNLHNIKANPGQIEQVITNLVINARDAMPNGGAVIIESKNVNICEKTAANLGNVVPGPFIQTTIKDTGCGMTEDVRARIFEPFFTTKTDNNGIGLGLSNVHSIVVQSGGHISVESQPGIGTTMQIYLPVVFENIAVSPTIMSDKFDKPVKTMKFFTGNETILVVEDEVGVREMTVKVLKLHGYNVIGACSGMEALSICHNLPDPPQLMLIDVGLPDTTGNELADEFTTLWPDVKIILTSGYSSDNGNPLEIIESIHPFLAKPFRIAELIGKVRDVLMSSWEVAV